MAENNVDGTSIERNYFLWASTRPQPERGDSKQNSAFISLAKINYRYFMFEHVHIEWNFHNDELKKRDKIRESMWNDG